jgi:hydroxypyruvate isomerase
VPKFSANLSFLYQDVAFLDRFSAAAKDGFGAVEYLDPYAEPKAKVAETLKTTGLKQALFNVPSGDWAGGERGIACLPDRIEEFRSGVSLALDYAKALVCPQVNVISGLVPKGADLGAFESVLVEIRRAALRRCRREAFDRADQSARHSRLLRLDDRSCRAHPRKGRLRQSLHPV